MPALLVPLITAIGVEAGSAFLIMYAAEVATAVVLLGGLALSYSQQKKARRKAAETLSPEGVDRLALVSSTVAPRDMVLGRVRKSGVVFWKGSTGTDKATFAMAVALAGHEVDGLEEVYLNDELVVLDGGGNVQTPPYFVTDAPGTSMGQADAGGVLNVGYLVPSAIVSVQGLTYGGTYANPTLIQLGAGPSGTNIITSTPYATIWYNYVVAGVSMAHVHLVTGTATQSADSYLTLLFPSHWLSTFQAKSVAYVVAVFNYSEAAYPTGLPSLSVTIRGAKLYDPRSGNTVWSDNPALMIRHIYSHPMFGKANVSAAEDARFSAAANLCDTSTVYTVGGVAQTARPRYQAALVVPFGADPAGVFDSLAQAMAGSWAFAGGELYLKVGMYSASVMSLTEADLATTKRTGAAEEQQPISIVVHRERAQKFNRANVTMWDAAQQYKQTPLTPLISSAYFAKDQSQVLAQDVSMPAVSHAPQALHIAGIMMRDARDPLTVTLSFKLRAYPLELFDTVDLTIARYGWSGKIFQVIGRSLAQDYTLQLTLKESAAAIYDVDADFAPNGYAPNTALPSWWYVPPITNLAASSGTSQLLVQSDGTVVNRILVTWASQTDRSVTDGGGVEVQYRDALSLTVGWLSQVVTGEQTSMLISGVRDALHYVIRARAITSTSVGPWSDSITHQVVGKLEAPPPFDCFLVLVQPDGTRQFNFGYTATATPPDWLGADIRYVAGTDASPVWESMSPLQDVSTYYTHSPVEVNALGVGTWTFACRSIDTSYVRSTARVISGMVFPKRRLGNVFDEFSEQLEGWTGTKTGCKVMGGILVALDAGAWTTPASWTAWARWNQTPTSPIEYITPARDLGVIIVGSFDPTIDADGTVAYSVSTSTDGASWTAFGSVAAPFTSRWVKFKLVVTATGPAPVPEVRQFDYQISAVVKTEYQNDVVISTLTGSYRIGTGDIRVPLVETYTIIKRLSIVIQDGTAGTWSWQRVDNTLTYGPRIQFKLNGVLTDPAYVDFSVEGY